MLSINKTLIKTQFEQELCEAAFDNLQTKSKLRSNNFAYSIRELSRHILHRLAPSDDVQRCSWYKPTKNEKGEIVITRADRINYAIYGGFDNNALSAMGLNGYIDNARKNLLASIDSLSKYTHINKDTFDISDSETSELVNNVIGSFNGFVDCMNDIRQQVVACLEAEINQEILSATIYETYSDIDILSTHSSIENYCIDSITVDDITSQEVVLKVSGSVDVRLQYGSDGDQRRGDGYVTNMNIPYEASVSADIKASLKKFHLNGNIQFDFDTNPYYE
ncbi:hypothetical protein [uncultured Prevotella sp.]|uniref:pPIWI-associating nuclease domain-containing protein n=1 Tax=uncultured Prevotella sp. TaxID=159272 RepID=UPI0027E26624|nr:hypothetical protein [uncultured Prevotella sp.]